MRHATIKRHFGKAQTRPVVKLTICIGDVLKQTEVNLVDRAGFNYRLLIGRSFLSNVLSGMFSLGGHPDKALIEYRVRFDPVFEAISYQGVPDVRIIVFLGVPVMSMVRLPTRMSDGKANLHQGAIDAGIDLATGRTLSAVWHNQIVEEHPDTGNPVTGIAIPHWDRLLELASRCYELTGLGYIGVDLALDQEFGPLILELNARPGLNIQCDTLICPFGVEAIEGAFHNDARIRRSVWKTSDYNEVTMIGTIYPVFS